MGSDTALWLVVNRLRLLYCFFACPGSLGKGDVRIGQQLHSYVWFHLFLYGDKY